jgi:hypothetical protein
MTLSPPSLPPPVPAPDVFKPLWSFAPFAPPRGLSLAREKGWLLAWDDNHWLYLVNARGERQAQVRTPAPLSAAGAADDGSAYAAVGGGGEVWWLAPDLRPRWQRPLPRAAVAVALDPFGQYLAAADAGGGLHLFDRGGRLLWGAVTPRPLRHLSFVPEESFLLGAADFGLVACLDLTGRIVWRDGLVVHCGSLAVSGDGACVVLACFSDGLRRYTLDGARKGPLAVSEPCRQAALTFDGRLVLVAGRANRLLLLDPKGRALGIHLLDRPAAAVALDALGERAVVALTDAGVVALDLRGAGRGAREAPAP